MRPRCALGIERLRDALPRLAELPLGGTAVGTGINMPPGFAARDDRRAGRATGLPLTEARDHFEAQGAQDALVETIGPAADRRGQPLQDRQRPALDGLRARAPGLREINIPDLQPGSSIMPGKVNPVIPEAVCMVSAQVIGNDAAIAFGGAAGNFELNVMLPMLARNILESIRLLANVSRLFADRCIAGISANADRARQYAEGSPSIVTPLNRYIGYEEAAKVAKQALAEGKTIREVVLERGYVDDGKLTAGAAGRGAWTCCA